MRMTNQILRHGIYILCLYKNHKPFSSKKPKRRPSWSRILPYYNNQVFYFSPPASFRTLATMKICNNVLFELQAELCQMMASPRRISIVEIPGRGECNVGDCPEGSAMSGRSFDKGMVSDSGTTYFRLFQWLERSLSIRKTIPPLRRPPRLSFQSLENHFKSSGAR